MEAIEQRPAVEMTPQTSEHLPADTEIVEEHEPRHMSYEPDAIEEEFETPQSSDYGHAYFTPLEQFPEESIEELFADVHVPSWTEQLTVRALVVSFIFALLFIFVAIKVNLTIGLVPTVTLPVALLGYCLVDQWIALLSKLGFESRPFTRQENTIILTCFSTAYDIAFSGGVGTYLLAMTRSVSEQAGEGKNAKVVELSLGWIIPFLFCVSYAGSFIAVILRKTLIKDLKLAYPSGTAAGELINNFHTPHGSDLRRKQTMLLIVTSGFSLAWGSFKWSSSGGSGCGFNNFPTFGLGLYKKRLYFGSSSTYVGMGMISPYRVTCSLFIGAVLSWGLLWPLIEAKKGKWYDANLKDNSFHGLQGYKVAIPMAIIFGDALYKFLKVMYLMVKGQYDRCKPSGDLLPSQARPSVYIAPESYDDERRALHFALDPIARWKAIMVYIFFLIISLFLLPLFYPSLAWYHVVVWYLIAILLAFCNAYGSGVTDWSLAASYGRFIIFVTASWAGVSNDGVLLGLAACGVISNIVSSAAGISQDMKTGYMTLTSPRAMLIAQIVGVTMGCLLTPLVFSIFLSASPNIGGLGSEYPAPNALVFRLMGIIGVEGFKAFPEHCLLLCLISFLGALAFDIIIDVGERFQQKWAKFIPLPMAMAIPFYVGGSFTIDMCVGSIILYLWGRITRVGSDKFARIFAAGLILGDGMWTMVSSVLPIFGIKPSLCLRVLPGDD